MQRVAVVAALSVAAAAFAFANTVAAGPALVAPSAVFVTFQAVVAAAVHPLVAVLT